MQVHSASFSDQSYSRNTRIGAVYYSSLEPPLPTDTLPEGSECQLYGCTLSSDFATYWEIEGERCIISLSGVCSEVPIIKHVKTKVIYPYAVT